MFLKHFSQKQGLDFKPVQNYCSSVKLFLQAVPLKFLSKLLLILILVFNINLEEHKEASYKHVHEAGATSGLCKHKNVSKNIVFQKYPF